MTMIHTSTKLNNFKLYEYHLETVSDEGRTTSNSS